MSSRKFYYSEDPVTQYIVDNSLRMHPVQDKLIKMTLEHSKGVMLSSAEEIQFLANICKAIGAKRTLDVGVYTGHSALMVALALPPDGKVVAIDITDEYPEMGRPYWREAGVENKIDLRIGKGATVMAQMCAEGEAGTYDFAFLDADKVSYDECYERALELLRPGGIIALDNTLWRGKVVDRSVNDDETEAIRALNKKIHKDTRVDVSFLNMGDGTTLAFKK